VGGCDSETPLANSGLRQRVGDFTAGKIFINYRRDDDPSAAARVRDGLAAAFGEANLFMDVDNLLVGQKFENQLARALEECDVFIAILGPDWLEALEKKIASGGRNYVREEIATAIARKKMS
jgi:TIR domain